MKELLVGSLMIVMVLALSGIGFLLFPIFLLLGIFFRLLVGLLLLVLVVWLIGKLTFLVIELLKPRQPRQE
ncbi:MAG TPA: hypothetical protein PLL75_04855 [Candidatus Omnitrophota bacterium]|nr:hypothetical protein [Candidatus Omnitrophota bacterium]HPS37038.1 hypothetical protein [Candidatus Omnitrophota bacterium]